MADISKQALRKEIAAILKGADLAGTTAKNVREELEEKLDCKLISRKKEIDELVMEYVSKAAEKTKGKKKESEDEEEEEEHAEEKESEEEEEETEEEEEEKKPVKRASAAKKPPAKRAKNESDDSDASDASGDASEEEYTPVKRSPAKPRGRKPTPKKKKGSDSDGDEDWVQEKPAPRKSGGGGGKGKGYTRPLKLSPELADLVGQEVMARHEVIKKMWSIIKERNLYDPKNKQYAICDESMQKVIGVKRFRMFGMMKYLKDHFIA